ncbi:MAG: maleylpyruvate isomerase family mycothiol-dependent enzyme [Jiangellaceae bacterium]|nr:maleylpyruvate isomerase family mycothiol-dependent enzyme [Jiangellaceae bacterium]
MTAATERLLRTAGSFDDTSIGAPSMCPGWTRAHVLSHVARNADSHTNLFTWARTGVQTPQYPSREARAADIDAGARRSAAEIVEDVRASAQRFSAAVASLPDEAWERQVRMGPAATGRVIPARRVLWHRLREVEIHHVDLDSGYAPADWSPAFVARALSDTYRDFGRRDDVPAITLVVDGVTERLGSGGPTVTGSAAAVLGWLTGRSMGADLRVHPPGPLPTLPPWA